MDGVAALNSHVVIMERDQVLVDVPLPDIIHSVLQNVNLFCNVSGLSCTRRSLSRGRSHVDDSFHRSLMCSL